MEQSQPLLTVAELISHTEQLTKDIDVVYDHYKNGTLDKFYTDMLDQTVETLMLMPMRRQLKNLPMVDEPESISIAVAEIAEMIAVMCGKPSTQVQQDLMTVVHKFPADDVRQSTYLRQNNLLN